MNTYFKNIEINPNKATFVEVLLPLAIPQSYTYALPLEFVREASFGKRVEVPLKNKLIAGLIVGIHQEKPISKTRNIISILDGGPIIQPIQLQFWNWISTYYLSNLGEVMSVALPGGLKLSSESTFIFVSHSQDQVAGTHKRFQQDGFLSSPASWATR